MIAIMKITTNQGGNFMKISLKKILATVLAIVVTIVSMGNVELKAASPKKLGKSDFVYTCSGKKVDFAKDSKDSEWAWYVYASGTESKNCKWLIDDFKTKRKVVDGSTLAFVKKQYGNQSLKKIKRTTNFYKGVKYDCPSLDISTWKNYLTYSYKEGKNKNNW